MKTAVKQVAIAFRQWQKDWENYDGKKAPKPLSFDEFIKPFLELEKQQIIDAYNKGEFNQGCNGDAEQYNKETFKNN